MPKQGPGSRDHGPFPGFLRDSAHIAAIVRAEREETREGDLFLLWHECYDSAIAHLMPQLRAAWIEAETRYLHIAKERGLL